MDDISVWQSIVVNNLDYVTRIPAALFTLGVGYLIIRVARRVIAGAAKVARVEVAVRSMIVSTTNFVGWILNIAAALSVMQLHQLSLALGGSIALVAMALATGLNSVTQDLLAGIFLLSDGEFKVGVRTKAGGVEGIVEELTIRKTRIRDDAGNLHTVPNRNVDGAVYMIYPEQEVPAKTG